MAILSFHNVSKDYDATDGQPVRALRTISLDVEPGELVALVGRSGCGKSTLLHLAGAMDFPTCGEVLIDGQQTTGLNDAQQTKIRRETVGFVFQSFQLIHTLTMLENVELPLLLAGKSDSRRIALQRLSWVDSPSGIRTNCRADKCNELLSHEPSRTHPEFCLPTNPQGI
jgi:ABC-type lipoprotein export system ATPase subunit